MMTKRFLFGLLTLLITANEVRSVPRVAPKSQGRFLDMTKNFVTTKNLATTQKSALITNTPGYPITAIPVGQQGIRRQYGFNVLPTGQSQNFFNQRFQPLVNGQRNNQLTPIIFNNQRPRASDLISRSLTSQSQPNRFQFTPKFPGINQQTRGVPINQVPNNRNPNQPNNQIPSQPPIKGNSDAFVVV